MKNLVAIILKAVALAMGVATFVLGLMQSITVGQGVMLLALGQTCLALSTLQIATPDSKEKD